MAFEDTQFYKEFGDCAWKVTLTDGSVKKSKAWLLKNEDSQYKEVTPFVAKKETTITTKKSKTIIQSKLK
jgi:hypothetical protein